MEYLRALAGAFTAMAALIATELVLVTLIATGYALAGGVNVAAATVQAPLHWALVSGLVALSLSLIAAPAHRDIYAYALWSVPRQLVRRTLPAQMIVIGVVELLLLLSGRL